MSRVVTPSLCIVIILHEALLSLLHVLGILGFLHVHWQIILHLVLVLVLILVPPLTLTLLLLGILIQ